jgi:hypothetical protein
MRYLLPVFPAFSLLAADVLVRGTAQRLRPWMNRYVRSWGASCVYVLCLAPFLMAGLWLGRGPAWSGWATLVTLLSAAGALVGLYLLRVERNRWAPLAALSLVLVAAKLLVNFGFSETSNRRGSPRMACERIQAVPPSEPLYLYGKLPIAAMFYLDGQSSGLRAALAARVHAFACTGPGKGEAAEPFPGVRHSELARVQYARDELILVRLDELQTNEPQD